MLLPLIQFNPKSNQICWLLVKAYNSYLKSTSNTFCSYCIYQLSQCAFNSELKKKIKLCKKHLTYSLLMYSLSLNNYYLFIWICTIFQQTLDRYHCKNCHFEFMGAQLYISIETHHCKTLLSLPVHFRT